MDEVKNTPKPSVPATMTATNPPMTVTMNGQTSQLYKNTGAAYHAEISKTDQDAIFGKVCKLMETAPGFIPATLHGEKVISVYFSARFWNHFKIKDHKIYDLDDNGAYKEL